ncbi:MAG: metallophosphoesterase [Candidatus Riflebacteria bacterium]
MPKCLNIIHISDLHFHVNEYAPENSGAKLVLENLSYIGKTNKSLVESNTVVIITGDLTESGICTEYSKLANALGTLSANHVFFSAVPGNHDYQIFNKGGSDIHLKSDDHRKAFIPVDTGYPRLEFNYTPKEKFYPLYFNLRGHHFIGLNSVEGVPTRDVKPIGNLGKRQLERLKALLDSLQSRGNSEKVILYTHHHPFPLPFGGDKDPKSTHSMSDWKKFNDLIGSYNGPKPPADVLLFGHVHMQMPFIQGNSLHDFLEQKGFGCAKIPLILASGKTPLHSRAVIAIDAENNGIRANDEKRSAFLLHLCKDSNFQPQIHELDFSRPIQDQIPSLGQCSLSHI